MKIEGNKEIKHNDFEHWKDFRCRENQRLEDTDLWFEQVPSFSFYYLYDDGVIL